MYSKVRRFGYTGLPEQLTHVCARYGAYMGWDVNRVLRFLEDSGATAYGILSRFAGSQSGSTVSGTNPLTPWPAGTHGAQRGRAEPQRLDERWRADIQRRQREHMARVNGPRR